MNPKLDPTVFRTPNLICPACAIQRVHTDGERTLFHPFSGHGCNDGKWTDPRLDPESVKARYLASLQGQAAAAYTPLAQVVQRGNK